MSVQIPARSRRPAGRQKTADGFNFALWVAVALLVALSLTTLLAGVISNHDPNAIGKVRLASPSGLNWLGTDNLGRDIFTRTAVAARADLLISLLATILAAIIGTAAGLVAGYHGGWIDNIIMRIIDVALSVPAILFALLIGVTFGAGLWTLVIALGLIFSPIFARVMRAPTLVLSQREFVVSAQLNGLKGYQVILRHILPNAIGPFLVQFANTASVVIMLEASLSYLGQGVQPPDPSAGRMVSEAQRFLTDSPFMLLAPMGLIVLMTFAWNLLADGIQKKMGLKVR